MRLLSTKILRAAFKDRLIQHGFTVVEYPFIKISPQNYTPFPLNTHLIFTSQNAVKFAFEHPNLYTKMKGKNCFCVGEKTKSILEENGQKVIKMTQNAHDLAHFLIKNYKNERFSFLCGQRRRPEIEAILHQHKMELTVHELYTTTLTSKHFEIPFDGILFFSPSAVESYFAENDWSKKTHGFCIGETTSESLSKFTNAYSIAKSPSEAQLLLILKAFYNLNYV